MSKVSKRSTKKTPIAMMVERIVKRFHPEQIILFGSHARGEAGPHSDVDLLIVMDFEGSAWDKGLDILQTLHDFLISKDIIVTRPEDFAWRKDVVCTIEWIAVREGKVLHGPT